MSSPLTRGCSEIECANFGMRREAYRRHGVNTDAEEIACYALAFAGRPRLGGVAATAFWRGSALSRI